MLEVAETPECSEVWTDEEYVRLGTAEDVVVGTVDASRVGACAVRRSWSATS
jgi:hypothetical protein